MAAGVTAHEGGTIVAQESPDRTFDHDPVAGRSDSNFR